MSETVTLESLKPNSYKSKEEPTLPEKKTEKVIKGEVVTKKKSAMSRFNEAFFDGDFKTAVSYAICDVIFPSIKHMTLDAIANGFEMLLFGTARGRSSERKGGNERVSYASYYKSDNRNNSRNDAANRNTRYDYRDIILATRGEAEEVIDVLTGIVEEYGQATVADLYDAVGITGNFTDNKYGWVNLNDARVRLTRDGYLLDLPKAVLID